MFKMHLLTKGEEEDSPGKCLVLGRSEDNYSETGIAQHGRTQERKKQNKTKHRIKSQRTQMPACMATHQKLGDFEINNNVD